MQYALEHGIIDLAYVQEQVEMNKRKELLEKHPYKIWEGSDGNWYTYFPDKERGRVRKKRSSQQKIETLIVEYWEQESYNPTLKEVFDEWNDRRLYRNKICNSSHSRLQRAFKRFYSVFGEKRIKNLKPINIEEFLEDQIVEHDLTAKAFSDLKSMTRGFLHRAKKRGLIDWNIELMFSEMDVSDHDFKVIIKEDYEMVFDEEEMPLIIDYLQQNLDAHNLCILLMFVTGIRIGEAVALRRECISENTIKIRRTETFYKDSENNTIYEVREYPKTKAGVREVVIPKDYEWILKRLLMSFPMSGYVFEKNGERLTACAVRRRMERICKKIHIYPKSPHDIRRTYGTILLDNNVDNRLIIQQMGHTAITCTEDHYHRNRRKTSGKQNIISKIQDFQNVV